MATLVLPSGERVQVPQKHVPHFKAGIVEGGATSIMSSYNKLNGVINTENPLLLKDILRDTWEFQGFVVPDSGATEDMVRIYQKYATNEEATAAAIRPMSSVSKVAARVASGDRERLPSQGIWYPPLSAPGASNRPNGGTLSTTPVARSMRRRLDWKGPPHPSP